MYTSFDNFGYWMKILNRKFSFIIIMDVYDCMYTFIYF